MLVEHKAGYIEKDIAVNTPDFWELNLKVGYDFTVYKNIGIQLNAGVRNIFNAYKKILTVAASEIPVIFMVPACPVLTLQE